MWDMNVTRPVMTFDMLFAVGDIEWAPYSSTVFAAVTSNGMLYVWDLYLNKHKHLCEHTALKKLKALHVSFNKDDPIILVGDDKGGVNSFKLSKALRKGPLVHIVEKKDDGEKEEAPNKVYPSS